MNWSKMKLQDCLVFYFQRNACLPEMKDEVLVVLQLLQVGDYTDIYGSDEQRSERPEHQGEGEMGIKRSKIVEELEGELALSSLPKKVCFLCEKTNSSCSYFAVEDNKSLVAFTVIWLNKFNGRSELLTPLSFVSNLLNSKVIFNE